jgi:hypothetical protein
LFFFHSKTMRNLLTVLAALLLLCAGCPGQKPALQQYEVASLAVESAEHTLSNEYDIYVEVGSDAVVPNSPLILVISDNENKFASIPLGGENTSGNTTFAIPWIAESAGEHRIDATIEDENGTIRSGSKTFAVIVSPIGIPEEKFTAGNRPVDTQFSCAQKFHISNNVTLSEAQLRLISLIPTREGLSVVLEIRNDTNGAPSDSAIESSKIPSRNVIAKSEWHTFTLEGNTYPPGDYWLVLKRGDDTGNFAWDYSQNGEGAACTDQSGKWFSQTGIFFFSIK